MFRNYKTTGLVLITFLLIAGIFAQTNILCPTFTTSRNSSISSEQFALKTPKASDVSGHYDYGDGTTMDINAVDNTTTTTLTNTTSGESFTIESKKNDTSTSTLLNNSYVDAGLILTSDVENQFQLESFNNTNPLNKIDLIIPNKNQMALNATGTLGESVEFFSNAKLDEENDSLDSFYAQANYTNGFFNVSYLKDDPDGYDLDILPPGLNTSINYDAVANEYKWIDKTHRAYIPFPGPGWLYFFTSEYTINNSGVWRDTTQVIDWTTPDLQTFSFLENQGGDIFQVNITKYYETIVIHYSTFQAPGRVGLETYLYQLVFTNTTFGTIMMDYEYSPGPMRVHWRDKLITIYYPAGDRPEYAVFTYQLWNIGDLIYNVGFELANLRIMFLKKWNDIIVSGVRFGIVYIESSIYISMETALSPMGSIWGSQFWGLKVSYRFDTSLNLFLVYKIEIGYKSWIYTYFVPTLILPNFLTIWILQSIYTNTTFSVTIGVTNIYGDPRPGAMITGTWDGVALQQGVNITPNGDGSFDINITARLVPPGSDPKWLNLTASEIGYTNGTLNTGIAVDPDTVKKEPTGDGDGDGVITDDDDGGGDRDLWEEEVILGYNLFILIGVVSILSIILVKKHKKIKI